MTGSSVFFDIRGASQEPSGSAVFFDLRGASQIPRGSSTYFDLRSGVVAIPALRVKNLNIDAPLPAYSRTVGNVPVATAHQGSVVYVTDEVGGAVLAFSDGTNWLRVTDRAIIS